MCNTIPTLSWVACCHWWYVNFLRTMKWVQSWKHAPCRVFLSCLGVGYTHRNPFLSCVAFDTVEIWSHGRVKCTYRAFESSFFTRRTFGKFLVTLKNHGWFMIIDTYLLVNFSALFTSDGIKLHIGRVTGGCGHFFTCFCRDRTYCGNFQTDDRPYLGPKTDWLRSCCNWQVQSHTRLQLNVAIKSLCFGTRLERISTIQIEFHRFS